MKWSYPWGEEIPGDNHCRNFNFLFKIPVMKNRVNIFGLLLLTALSINCHPGPVDNKQAAIDSLNNMINLLKPGLGEFMMQLEYHHDKLAGAIADKNFEKAGFEVGEMKEVAEKVEQLNITNDKLQKPFSLLFEKYLQSPLAVLAEAAAKKDGAVLQTSLVALTNNCNGCHRENNMNFMKVN
jgi:hypothetical protein